MSGIGMIIGKLARLRSDCLRHLLPPIADINAIEAGERIEAALTVAISHIHSLAADDDPVRRLAAGMSAHGGGGMEEVISIPGLDRIAVLQHESALGWWFRQWS